MLAVENKRKPILVEILYRDNYIKINEQVSRNTDKITGKDFDSSLHCY